MILDIKQQLVKDIKETKLIKNLNDDYIKLRLEKYILTNADTFKKLKISQQKKDETSIKKDTNYIKILKDIRNELRITYHSFLNTDFFKKEKILEKINSIQDVSKLLITHKSTKERMNYYDTIYLEIFKWYKPKHGICDLGCGLNPLTIKMITLQLGYDINYFCFDLSKNDMDFLNSFFLKFEINAKAYDYDLTDTSFISKDEIEKSDLIFMFKLLDSLEFIKKNVSKSIITELTSKNKKIVVSFPTKSLISKTQFDIKKRNWLFNFLNKNEIPYKQFETENELFILIN